VNHEYDFIYFAPYALISIYTRCNKEVSLRPLQEAQHLQIKIFHAMKQPTQGWILENYA
jgi:hypothetical protein